MANDMKQAVKMIKEKIREYNAFLKIEINDSKTYSKPKEKNSRFSLTEEASIRIIKDFGGVRASCPLLSEISSILDNFGIDYCIIGDGHGSRDNILKIPGDYPRDCEAFEEQKKKINELVKEINEEISKSQ